MSVTKGLGDRIAQERRLKAARDQRDVDQRDVANAIGVTPGVWETAKEAGGSCLLTQPPGQTALRVGFGAPGFGGASYFLVVLY